MLVTVYLHGSKETFWDKGEELGMSEEACQVFQGTLYEVEFELDVDIQTGKSVIKGVNGTPLYDDD